MTWFAVWDDTNEDMESAWGVEAGDAEEAAELYMEHGEENSWWVGGDEYPDELVVLEHAGTDREVCHIVDVTVDWSPTFTSYRRPPIGCALPASLAIERLLEASRPKGMVSE